jgi:hypothetical protein
VGIPLKDPRVNQDSLKLTIDNSFTMLQFFGSLWARLISLGLSNFLAILVFNMKRMGRFFQFFGHVASYLLYPLHKDFYVAIPRLIADLETIIISDVAMGRERINSISKWFKVFISSGSREIMLVSRLDWSYDHKCPKILIPLLGILSSLSSSSSHYKVVIAFLVSLFSIFELHMENIIKESTTKVDNRTTGVVSTLQVTKYVSLVLAELGLNAKSLGQTLSDIGKSNTLALNHQEGVHGGPSKSAILDAQMIKRLPTLQMVWFGALDDTGQDHLLKQYNSVSSLPLIKGINLLVNLCPRFMSHWLFGIQGLLKANIWLVSLFVPFNTISSDLLIKMGGSYIGGNDQIGYVEKAAIISGDSRNVVTSYNVINNGGISHAHLTALVLSYFGVNASNWMPDLTSPLIEREDSQGKPILQAELVTMAKYSSQLRLLVILLHATLLFGSCLELKIAQESSYLITDHGSVVIMNEQLAKHMGKLYGEMGVNISTLTSSSPSEGETDVMVECNGMLYYGGHLLSWLSPFVINNFLSNGAYGWLIQYLCQRSGADLTSTQFWGVITPFLNKQDYTFLVLLNTLPTKLTGFRKALLPDKLLVMSDGAWYKDLKLEDLHIQSLFVYLMVSELLISLDATINRYLRLTEALRTIAVDVNSNTLVHPDTEKEVGIESLNQSVSDGMVHPLLPSLQAKISEILSLCYSLVNGIDALSFVQILKVFSVLDLLNGQRHNEVQSNWLNAYKIMITKLITIAGLVTKPDHSGILETTVKLHGFSHPFIVTWSKSGGVVLTTLQSRTLLKLEDSLNHSSQLSKINFFDPYAKK